MLSQAEANLLAALEKILIEPKKSTFPGPGQKLRYSLKSIDDKEKFVIAIVRGGKRQLKCSYTEICRGSIVLLRVDTEHEIHFNPDGVEVPTPHIHIYSEGYDTRYAYPLPDSFSNSSDLIQTLYDLLSFSMVININDIVIRGGLFDASVEAK